MSQEGFKTATSQSDYIKNADSVGECSYDQDWKGLGQGWTGLDRTDQAGTGPDRRWFRPRTVADRVERWKAYRDKRNSGVE